MSGVVLTPPVTDDSPFTREVWNNVLDSFDHRDDGLAARARFDRTLRLYLAIISDGTVRTSKCRILSLLIQAEKRIKAGQP